MALRLYTLRELIEHRLNSFRLLDMQPAIFALATQFIREYRLSEGLTLPDAIIGASAIFYEIPLLTYNRKDFIFLPAIQLAQFD